jgi:DNA modification methylase
MKSLLKLGDEMDFLLTREPIRGPQRDYEYLHDTYVVNEDINDRCEHPCQKPIRVISHLCDSLSQKGETVFDPFMGSGTTGVAALHTGRRFIGIEKDADFFRVASERISSANSEL